MTGCQVIDLQPALNVKQLLNRFDLLLSQLQQPDSDLNLNLHSNLVNKMNVEHKGRLELGSLQKLSELLQAAFDNGVHPIELQSRTLQLTQIAFSVGYSQEEVEALLTDC